MAKKLEDYIPVVAEAGLNTNKNAVFGGSVTFNGSVTGAGGSPITSTSANAFAVGPAGNTNPSFNVDASTGSAVTGLNVKSNTSGGAIAVSTLSSATNENLTLDAKGSGTIGINQVSTTSGLVTLGNGTSKAGAAVNGALTVTSASASALAVGPNGSTNPALVVDGSQASEANGISITGVVAGSSARIGVISSAASESLLIDAKTTGTITLGNTSTGAVAVKPQGVFQATNAQAFTVGQTAFTNPAFNVDTSTASSATGLNIKSAAAAGGLAVTTISTGTDENLTIAAKGAGTVTFNPAVVAAAGGAANDGIKFGSIGVGLFTGTGAPSFSAMNGSIYVDSNATSTTTRIYVNKSGAGTAGTTWTNLTTAA